MDRVRVVVALLLVLGIVTSVGAQQQRRTLGLALGGGSARGFAHVGVLRWLEEHQVPVAAIAGTSMGALVGGAYATGMSAGDLQRLIAQTDWDEVFGVTSYQTKGIRRKQDARDYPSRLEYYLGGGAAVPSALNNGVEVQLLLSRVAAVYGELASFDSLPTRFRCVALDLRTGLAVVLDSGSLPVAMRATMSLPAIFPPVEVGRRLVVDGGPMDNVPADVARKMGVDMVIAVNVSSGSDTIDARVSMFSVGNAVVDALQRANTQRGIAAADAVIYPDLHDFSGLDWRRADEMAAAGYAAAEQMRDTLLPFAVDDAAWQAYLAARSARKAPASRITAIRLTGMTPHDRQRTEHTLRDQIGRPIEVGAVEHAVRQLSGLGSYQSIAWDVRRLGSTDELAVHATGHRASPILMLTTNAENRTSTDYVFQLAARTLSYDHPTAGDELRLDGAFGTNPRLAAELLHDLTAPRSASVFVAVGGAWESYTFNVANGDALIAQYTQKLLFAQGDLGVEGPHAELRAGVRGGHVKGSTDIGDAGLPSIAGNEAELRLRGVFDTQNSATVPSNGLRVIALGRRVLAYPDESPLLDGRTNHGLWQSELTASNVWSWRQRRERLFLVGAGGSSFGNTPLLTDQFALGRPLRLDAFEVGERRGDNYGVLTMGYLHVLARLPGFLGGAIMAGGWVETGSAWNSGADASVVGQGAVGAIIETLVGPAMVRYSAGGGARRFAFRVGEIF